MTLKRLEVPSVGRSTCRAFGNDYGRLLSLATKNSLDAECRQSNPVKGQQLLFNQDANRPHLLWLAALAYNVALRTFTEPWFPSDGDDERHDFFLGLGDIENALAKAL